MLCYHNFELISCEVISGITVSLSLPLNPHIMFLIIWWFKMIGAPDSLMWVRSRLETGMVKTSAPVFIKNLMPMTRSLRRWAATNYLPEIIRLQFSCITGFQLQGCGHLVVLPLKRQWYQQGSPIVNGFCDENPTRPCHNKWVSNFSIQFRSADIANPLNWLGVIAAVALTSAVSRDSIC